jgi:hypothetical protein
MQVELWYSHIVVAIKNNHEQQPIAPTGRLHEVGSKLAKAEACAARVEQCWQGQKQQPDNGMRNYQQ